MRDPFKDFKSADGWFENFRKRINTEHDRIYKSTAQCDYLYDRIYKKSPELNDIINRADRRFGLGDTLKTLFSLLYSPELHKNSAVSAKAETVQRPVTEALFKSDAFPKLKAVCENSGLAAFSAVSSIAEGIEQLTQSPELSKTAETAEIISVLKSQTKRLTAKADSEKNPDKRLFLIKIIFKKQKQIKDLKGKLKEQGIMTAEEISENINRAAEKALDAANKTLSVLRAFGDAEAGGRANEANRELLDRVRRNETLKQIAYILGRYREMLADKRKNSFSYGLGEKYDIAAGRSINNCLSSELSLLGMPQTETLFIRKYYAGHLKQYRRRGRAVKCDGDMIVMIDESGSTSGIAPWIKAFAFALMDIALHNGKKYALIHFANRENVKTEVFEKGKFQMSDILAAAEHFFGGGTDFEAPLNEALSLLQNGFEKADAVIITDGQCRVSDEFSEKFREQKLKSRVTVTGILLDRNSDCGESLIPFCDKIYRTSKLSEEEIALEVLGGKS